MKPRRVQDGYARCVFDFGMDEGGKEPEPGVLPRNPFAEWTPEWEGWEEGFYDFTQK